MPELPEVEGYRRLAERALGREITGVDVHDPRCLAAGTTPKALRARLVGTRLVAARRRGKLLVLDGCRGAVGLRFGMTGILVVDGRRGVDRLLYAGAEDTGAEDAGAEDTGAAATNARGPRGAGRWSRLVIRFADGEYLALKDQRIFGRVVLDPDEEALGPDALGLTRAQLDQVLATRPPRPGPALKARLLDQAKVAGLGNLVTDEVLFQAGLSPLRPCGSLTKAEADRLASALASTLLDLVHRGGSHLGEMTGQRHPGGTCPRDGTAMERTMVNGRSTWWCPAHQV